MNIFQISLQGAVFILAVIILRIGVKIRLPKTVFFILWDIALLRLLLPLDLPSPTSIYSHISPVEILNTASQEAIKLPISPLAGLVTASPIQKTASFSLWIAVWLLGIFTCVVFFNIVYWKCHREFQASLKVETPFISHWLAAHKCMRPIEIRQSDRINGPLTYNILRPVILLPEKMDWADEKNISYILIYEYIHIRRFDAVRKLLFTAAVCIHWFNPVIWIMFLLANKDNEFSCDEAVLRFLGDQEKSFYAYSLIHMEEAKNSPAPLCSNYNKQALEERIVNIMKYKKASFASVIISMVLVVGTATVFATSSVNTHSFPMAEAVISTTVINQDQISYEKHIETLLKSYERYGITYNSSSEKLFYHGKPIRYFLDAAEIDSSSQAIYFDYLDKNGTIDLFTVRKATDNGDGSVDPGGQLVDILLSSEEEFAARSFDTKPVLLLETTEATGNADTESGKTFAEIFDAYKDYGVTYQEGASSSYGNVYYKGTLVKQFIDQSSTGIFTFASKDDGDLTLHTAYDENGRLTGVEVSSSRQ